MSEIVDVWGPPSLDALEAAVRPAIHDARRYELRNNFGGTDVRFVFDNGCNITVYPIDHMREAWEPDYRVSVEDGGPANDRTLMAWLCQHLVSTTDWGVMANPSDDSTGYVERPPLRTV